MWFSRHQHVADSSSTDADGGYLASASDLMIGLLFVFIILVVVLALEQRRQQQEMDNQLTGVMGAGDPLIAVTGSIGNALEKAFPNVRVDPKTGVISLPEGALFARGSAELSEDGRQVLAKAADQLVKALPCFVDNKRGSQLCPENPYKHEIETIFIEGHTDSVPFSRTGRDNFDLSLARARAVEQAIVLNSPLVDFKNRAGQQIFSFSAYADKRPLPDTDPTDGVNRRVDLRIVLSYKPIEELLPTLKRLDRAGPQ